MNSSSRTTSTASPLRDRLLSNSPDPVKSAILRDSGQGWNSNAPATTATAITPLRIAKRDSPQRQLARRQSSSYNHVRNNNLVSKSPFKSQIPTARKVSGEKRPRPQSMSDQAENERPLGFKRRQSKAFQGLVDKEPVTKSPFKRVTSDEAPPPPPKKEKPLPTRVTTLTTSPSRPSLISKRLHGPRSLSNSPSSESTPGRRQRRKTVTFDERCDVVEFDCEDHEVVEDPFHSDGEEHEGQDDKRSFIDENSVNDLVDDIWEATTSASETLPSPSTGTHASCDSDAVSTPPRNSPLPVDTRTESGIPLGRSAHVERSRIAREDGIEEDLRMLPPSPSPMRRSSSQPHLLDGPIPKFDIQLPATPPPTEAVQSDPLTLRHLEEDQSFTSTTELSNASMTQSDICISDLDEAINGMQGVDRHLHEHIPANESLSVSLQPIFTSPSSPPASAIPRGLGLVASDSVGSLNGRSPRISREEVQRRLMRKRSYESPLGAAWPIPPAPVSLPMPPSSPTPNGGEHSLETTSIASAEMHEATAELREATLERAEKIFVGGSVLMNRRDNATHNGVMSLDPNPQPDDPPRASVPVRPQSSLGDSGFGLNFDFGQPGVELGDMRSALDRLMEDVAGSSGLLNLEESRVEDDEFTGSGRTRELQAPKSVIIGMIGTEGDNDEQRVYSRKRPIERAATDPALLPSSLDSHSPGRTASGGSIPPAPPAKDNIRTREELIKEKRRLTRMLDDEESRGLAPPLPQRSRDVSGGSGSGKPSRRRSLSTGDAEDLGVQLPSAARRRADHLRDLLGVPFDSAEDPLADSIDRELKKLEGRVKKKAYHVRERGGTIYASSDIEEKISHMVSVGDLDSGKAWRTVRRPSDMNEYSKQIKEYRSQEKPGKSHGKVFVKVLSVNVGNVPVPSQPTVITCTLNNGIHFVTTPECRLGKVTSIEQEFELIEHSKLEFTLTLKVRRDSHIIEQTKSLAPPAPVRQHPQPSAVPASKGGMRGFFSSPKKNTKVPPIPIAPAPQPQPRKFEDNLARYLKPDGTLARAFVSFKDVASHCDTRLFETRYPLIGQRAEANGTASTLQVGEIVLQLFRLPPLPGIPQDQLPQSLEECHRGLRHINWHKVTYHEGTLTQNGGDCTTWRRRQLRVIGASLVAFNDVTKKATATIDLKKAIGIEDEQEARSLLLSPASGGSSQSRCVDDYEGIYGVERSFRLIFPRGQEITFFADTDEEKARWLEVLRALVGRIPPNPLWAELIWQRHNELTKQSVSHPTVSSPPTQSQPSSDSQR